MKDVGIRTFGPVASEGDRVKFAMSVVFDALVPRAFSSTPNIRYALMREFAERMRGEGYPEEYYLADITEDEDPLREVRVMTVYAIVNRKFAMPGIKPGVIYNMSKEQELDSPPPKRPDMDKPLPISRNVKLTEEEA